MNSDQMQSLIRGILRMISGAMAAYGITAFKDSAITDGVMDSLISVVMAAAIQWWAIYHQSQMKGTKPPVVPSGTPLLAALILPLFLVGCGTGVPSNKWTVEIKGVKIAADLPKNTDLEDFEVVIDPDGTAHWKMKKFSGHNDATVMAQGGQNVSDQIRAWKELLDSLGSNVTRVAPLLMATNPAAK